MKNNIDFYKHYANADQHPKFKMLRVKYGWSGEGKFWALNNRIALSENCFLDVKKKYNKAGLASDLSFSLEELDAFIFFLVEDCELILEESPGVVTTAVIQETLSSVMKKRKTNKSDYKVRLKESDRNNQTSESEIQTSESIQSTSTSTSKVQVQEKKAFLSDSIEIRLSNFLFSHILKNNPKAKKPNIQSWAKTIDLMIRADNRTPEDIRAVIAWSQKDSFWGSNILSASKLRKQFDQLWVKKNKIHQVSEFSEVTRNNIEVGKEWLAKKQEEREKNANIRKRH